MDGSLGDDDEDEDALEGLAEKNSSAGRRSRTKAARPSATTAPRRPLRSVRGRLRRGAVTAPPRPRRRARCSGRGGSRTPPPRRTPRASAARAPPQGVASRDASPSRTLSRDRVRARERSGRGGARVRVRRRAIDPRPRRAAATMEASGGDGSRDRSREDRLLEVMTTTKPVRNLPFRNVRTRPS